MERISPTLTVLLSLFASTMVSFSQSSHREGSPTPGAGGTVQEFTQTEWDASNFASKEDMKWFRDAKYGMFISFGLSTFKNADLSWPICQVRKPPDGGGASTPLSVWSKWADELRFEKFDAKKLVALAQQCGFKYIVVIAKHHDGFHLWNTKYSDFNVMRTPFGRDYLKELADACHASHMRFGIYYSQRDWYHPDYMALDPAKSTRIAQNLWKLKPGETSPIGERHKKCLVIRICVQKGVPEDRQGYDTERV